VLKDEPPEQLIAVTKRVIKQFTRAARPETPKGFEELTAREQPYISETTVKRT
jgi:hypothetical protein